MAVACPTARIRNKPTGRRGICARAIAGLLDDGQDAEITPDQWIEALTQAIAGSVGATGREALALIQGAAWEFREADAAASLADLQFEAGRSRPASPRSRPSGPAAASSGSGPRSSLSRLSPESDAVPDLPLSFTCPRCGRTSYDPRDVEEGYCGACHDWTVREFETLGDWVRRTLRARQN